MIAPRESITQEALKLPESERIRVIQDLLDSLCPESNDSLDDAWAAELDRRFLPGKLMLLPGSPGQT